ncbi:MAG: hypothetical protein JNL67_05775 [Planctomycetaceae bacterium]|nr:hypothetical protein [Planctomycetaceae bacterium]
MTIPPINPFAGMSVVGPDDRKAIQLEREHDKTQTQIVKKAAGDGEASATESASDRDADGRENWERRGPTPKAKGDAESPVPEAPRHSRDPSGQRGTHLDLDG